MSTASVAPGRPSTPPRTWRKARASTILSAAIFAAFADSTQAQTAGWLGASSDWFTAGNWSPVGVPTESTGADLNKVTPNATVIGPGNAIAKSLIIGKGATGMLTVQGGGTLTTGAATVGESGGSQGTVIVTGPGSNLTMTGFFVLGGGGVGTLAVENGATLNTAGSSFGQTFGSSGTATVTGTGSTWNNGGTGLEIGSFTPGTLTVAGGGLVDDTSAGGVKIGAGYGSIGMTTVTGAGSILRSRQPMIVGYLGTAGARSRLRMAASSMRRV